MPRTRLPCPPRRSRHGRSIVFARGDGDLYVLDARGRGSFQPLVEGLGAFYPVYSADGRNVLFHRQGENKYWHTWSIDLDRREPRQLLGGEAHLAGPEPSPDGTLLAHGDDSRFGVFGGPLALTEYPSLETRWQVADDQVAMAWRPDGR
jgi:hypothetical protein